MKIIRLITVSIPFTIVGCNTAPQTVPAPTSEAVIAPTVAPSPLPAPTAVPTLAPVSAAAPSNFKRLETIEEFEGRLTAISKDHSKRKERYVQIVINLTDNLRKASTTAEVIRVEFEIFEFSSWADKAIERAMYDNEREVSKDTRIFSSALSELRSACQQKEGALGAAVPMNARVSLDMSEQHIDAAFRRLTGLYKTDAQQESDTRQFFNQTENAMQRADQRPFHP